MTRSPSRSTRILFAAALLGAIAVGRAMAQDASPAGDWEGILSAPGAELPLVLHVTETEDGALAATLDSPAQGAFGIEGADVTFEEGVLGISFPDIAGSYDATMSEDGSALDGTWSQSGQSLELDLTRVEG